MRSRLLALVLAVIPAAFGCGDDIKFPDPIPPPDPALNAVVPAEGFTNRTIRVQISGDNSEFTDDVDVVFGTGITTDSVEVASPSSLFATITIGADAELGLRDVLVIDGDSTLTLSQAFDVADPIEVLTVGALQQGDFAGVLIVNRDTDNPWVGAVEVTAGNGVTFFVDPDDSTEFRLFTTAFFDTDAVTGRVVVTDTLANTTITSRGADLPVTARAATPLAPPVGKGPQGDLVATATLSGTSGLFSFPATSAMMTASVDTAAANGQPFFVWLENGKWANARGFVDLDLIPTTANTTMFLVVFDAGELSGYSFDVVVDELVALPNRTNAAEVEPNNLVANAQVVAGSLIVWTGGLADDVDIDRIKVSATAGQTIRVITTTGPTNNPPVDTEVAIFDTNGTTPLVAFTDNDVNEDIQSAPVLTTGDYFVVIRPSQFCLFFGCYLPANERFEVAILVETPPT